jgi:hypothetical protein
MRGGKDNDPRFGTRFTGEGVWAQLLQARFQRAVAKLGLRNKRRPVQLALFQRPRKLSAQGDLF